MDNKSKSNGVGSPREGRLMDDYNGLVSADPFDGDGFGQVICENVLVPPGEYLVRYLRYWTAIYWDKPKVFVEFSIVSPEEHAGLPVERMYNAAKLLGPPRNSGNFRPAPRGTLLREYRRLMGDPGRLDRISFAQLTSKDILAKITTVTKDRNRNTLTKADQYSRIDELIMIVNDSRDEGR
jgi:hypothetical protein